jgi:hypothetical protein
MITGSAAEQNVLVQALASHVKGAAASVAGGESAPGDPPVLAPPPPPAAQTADASKCECCGAVSLHDGQVGGRVVSEDVWYGLEEGDDLYSDRAKIDREVSDFLSRVSESAKKDLAEKGIPVIQLVTGPLRKRRERNLELIQRFELRRDALLSTREGSCRLLPEPPSDIYRVISVAAKKKIEAEWDLGRSEYEAANGLPVGARIRHRISAGAGGCPTGAPNLFVEDKLSKECLETLDKLTAARMDAEARWNSGGF